VDVWKRIQGEFTEVELEEGLLGIGIQLISVFRDIRSQCFQREQKMVVILLRRGEPDVNVRLFCRLAHGTHGMTVIAMKSNCCSSDQHVMHPAAFQYAA
jgi:hypothetical protein